MAERRLSCHHHVNDSSRSHHAMWLKAPPTCDVILQACVNHFDHNYLDWSVHDGKRAWPLFGIIFKQIRAQRRAAPGCFGFTGAKGCCGSSSHVFWEKFNLAVVRGSETQTKKKERGIVVASPLPSIINDQVEAMREAAISAVALPCRGTRGAADMLFFKNRKLSSSSLLSWNQALIKENPARVLLTWLLQGEQTLPDWSSACEIAKPRSLKSSANFRFVKKPWRTLSKKRFSSCSFTGMESLPRTIDVYKAPTYPTIIQSADLFRLQASFSRLFRRRSSLRRT